MNYEQHPIGACYPPLTAEEFKKLRAALHDPGSKSPAILFEGKILDGWHYYKACLQEGFEPQFETPHINRPVQFVANRNEGRRQLDDDQRADIALKMENCKWGGKDRGNQYQSAKSSNENLARVTRIEAAAAMKVSKAKVDRAQQIRDRAIPEVKEAQKAKKISQGRAADIAALPKDQQAAELAKWVDKKVQPRHRSNRQSSKRPTRSELAERRHQMLLKNKPPDLTREQVDPEFNGSSMDFLDAYGHVPIMTKEELAADHKQGALMDWLKTLNDLRLPLIKHVETKPFELSELEAYISKSRERRLHKLNEMVSLITAAKDRIERVLPTLSKLTASA